jgi:hypothetical protein
MFLNVPYAVAYFFAEGLPPLPQSYRHALGLHEKPAPAQPPFSKETQDMRTVLREMRHQKRGAVEGTTKTSLRENLAEDHTETLEVLLKKAREPFPMLSQPATLEQTQACAQKQQAFLKSMAEVRAQLKATIKAIRTDVSELSLSGRGNLAQTLETAERYLHVESRVKTNNRERVHLGLARTVAKAEALASKGIAGSLLAAANALPRSYEDQMEKITQSRSKSPKDQTEVERLQNQIARNTERLGVITKTAQAHAALRQQCAALETSQTALAGRLGGLGLTGQTYGGQRLADAHAALDRMRGPSTINRDYAHCMEKAARLETQLQGAQAKASKLAVAEKLAEIKAAHLQERQQSNSGATTPEALRDRLAEQQRQLDQLRALQQEANRLKQLDPNLHTGKRDVDSAAAAVALEVKATELLLGRMDKKTPVPATKPTQPASEPPTLTAQAPKHTPLAKPLASIPTNSPHTGASAEVPAPATLRKHASSAFAPISPSAAPALSTPATHTESNRGSRMETAMRRTPSLTAAGTASTHTTTSAAHAQQQLATAKETVV